MKRRKIFNIGMSVLLATLLMVSVFSSLGGIDMFPRSDELYVVICRNEDDMVAKALAGEIDWAKDLEQNITTLAEAGWNIAEHINYDFAYLAINCRDVAPSTSHVFYDYHGRMPGDPLFPLNISEFRFALQLIFGGEVKERVIKEIFDWVTEPQDTFVSPAYGTNWIAPISSVHDEVAALELLNSIGFYNTSGYWVNTNPAIGPTGEIRAGFGGAFEKTIRVLGFPEKNMSLSLVLKKCMSEWNRFFGKNSVGEDYFVYDELPWISVQNITYGNRDFDIVGLETPIVGRSMLHGPYPGRDCDYLYDMFHPYMDLPWGCNNVGLDDAKLNLILEQFKYTINYTTGEIITDIGDLQELCKQAQWMIYYLTPAIPLYYKRCFNAFDPWLYGWINVLGYGADNWWTYNWIIPRVVSQDPVIVRVGVSGSIRTLNPISAVAEYDWELLSRIYDSFIAIDPFTKDDIMWAIRRYTIVEWNNPSINVRGFNVTFYLRSGIKWHDGQDFNAHSAKWSWDFLAATKPPRYKNTWQFYVCSEVIDDQTVKVSINNTGFWYIYELASTAMIFHKPIWEPFWGDLSGALAFEPWKVKYDDWTGQTGHGDLTCLVGTGPWVFVLYHEVGLYARFMANRPFNTTGQWGGWLNYTGKYWAPFLREDVDFSGKVEMIDLWTVQKCFGAVPGHSRWNDGRCDVVFNFKVDMVDLWSVQKKFGKITLPP